MSALQLHNAVIFQAKFQIGNVNLEQFGFIKRFWLFYFKFPNFMFRIENHNAQNFTKPFYF